MNPGINNYFTVRIVGRPRYVPFNDRDRVDVSRAFGIVGILLGRSAVPLVFSEAVTLWKPMPEDPRLASLPTVGVSTRALEPDEDEDEVAA